MELFDVYFDVKLIISQPITASKDFRGYKMKIKKHGRQHSFLQKPFCFAFTVVYCLKPIATAQAKLIPIKPLQKKIKLEFTHILLATMNSRKQGEHNTIFDEFFCSNTLLM